MGAPDLKGYNLQRTNRVLVCRAHLKAFYYFLFGAATVWTFLGLMALANFGIHNDKAGVLWSAIVGLAVPVALFLVARFLVRPAAFTRIEITPDRLVVRRDTKEWDVKFSEIKSVKLSHLPFVAGWMKISTQDGAHFHFNVALERSEYILDALMAFNPQLVDAERAHTYRITAIYYDHSWARFSDRFKHQWPIMVKYPVGALAFTMAFFSLRLNIHGENLPNIYQFMLMWLMWVGFLSLLGASLWFLSETFILAPMSRRRLRKDALRPVRPVDIERFVNVATNLAYVIVSSMLIFALV